MNSYLMLLLHMNKVEGSGLSKKEAYGEGRHGLADIWMRGRHKECNRKIEVTFGGVVFIITFLHAV